MTKNTTYFLGILITILAGSYFFYTCCNDCGKEPTIPAVKKTELPPAPEATSFPFSLNHGAYSYTVNDNFNFNVSSYTILDSLSPKVTEGIVGLVAFLSENKTKSLTISGYYTSDETNTSAFPNLGFARANAIKNHLVSMGTSASQINISGEVMDEMVPKENIYLGPVIYDISSENLDAADELKVLYEKIKADPLVIYFETGKTELDLTTEERQKVADISRYLDKVEGATCTIVGHTDNSGARETNMELGLRRARFAKSYLVKNGISDAKITVSSQGPDVPLASNATEDGKAKNRRTTVTLN